MNTVNQTSPEAELKTAVDAFETSLVRPLVSGELTPWLDEVKKAWGEAGAQIHYHAKHLHPRQYEAIAKQDAELLPRVDMLKTEDAALEEQREQINQAVARVAQHAPKLEPDEQKAHKYIKSLVDDGMAFVTRVRKQSVAVQTWYIEAFNRDSGAAG
jgi:hypothetical protein